MTDSEYEEFKQRMSVRILQGADPWIVSYVLEDAKKQNKLWKEKQNEQNT